MILCASLARVGCAQITDVAFRLRPVYISSSFVPKLKTDRKEESLCQTKLLLSRTFM